MAISTVQSTHATGGPAISVTTPGLTTTANNLFICDGSYYIGTGLFSSITDAKSNFYSDAIAEIQSSAGATIRYIQQYKENGAGGGSHTFTLTMTVADAYPTIHAKEVTGAKPSGAADQISTKNNNSGTTGLTSNSTPTTAQANELLAGAGGWTSGAGTTTYTPQGSFVQDQNDQNIPGTQVGLVTASKVVAATGTYPFTFDIDVSGTGVIGAVSTWKEAQAVLEQTHYRFRADDGGLGTPLF